MVTVPRLADTTTAPPEDSAMIKQLTPEQVRDWTLEEKDRWWLENIWRGDMPQLTVRSAITGMLLGGLLSLTNLYVGIKTGWTLGVGITSVILSFALWKALAAAKVGSEMTLLENNAMQSIATSAGYMTAPLISSLSAYMMVTGTLVPIWQATTWMIAISLLGVLFAFPLKKRFINDEQLPFPEGKACGIVLDGLHGEDKADGRMKVRLLLGFGGLGALWKVVTSLPLMQAIKLGFLAIPGYVDEVLSKIGLTFWETMTIRGTNLTTLTVRAETDVVMVAAGGLIGIRTGVSLIIGAIINYFVLAPIMIQHGIIVPNAKGVIGFREITIWSLWGGVAMMTTASLYSFFSKPQVILTAFRGLFGAKKQADVLKDIELPMSVFVIGIPVVGALVVVLTHLYFGMDYWLGAVAIPLIFVFTLIAVNSTGLTSITPTGALGKLTQLTYAVLAPGNISTNLMTAGINGETASNASNLLMDIKPGYMLGAKPRQQAMGHVLGIIAGAIVAPPVFFAILGGNIELLGTEKLLVPGAVTWRAVAMVLTKGLSFLDVTARWAILIGALLGIVFELLRTATKGKFPLSGVGMGLAFVLPFYNSLSMFLGGLIFWAIDKTAKNEQGFWRRVAVNNQEAICAGVIAGGAIMGIFTILAEIRLG
jgi:uncharacterized oligopeptide transporter (OPT) family protein